MTDYSIKNENRSTLAVML